MDRGHVLHGSRRKVFEPATYAPRAILRGAVQRYVVGVLFVHELRTVFEALNDVGLIDALTDPPRRGPKGYPVRVLWHCFITKYYLGMDSTAALLRGLRDNPFLAYACGLTEEKGVPSEPTMSRFFKKLASKGVLPRLKDVSRALVRKHHATYPGFGRIVAIDSTTLKAWSNGGKLYGGKHLDPEAGWSVKKNTQGRDEFTWGWKLHLAVDTETQLPLAASVSAGNVHDLTRTTNLLSEARFALGSFRPKYVLADAGYSSDSLRRKVTRHYGRAFFDAPRNHKKAHMRMKNDARHMALRKQRTSVERSFSNLKRMHGLNRITLRRKMKVTAHANLSLIGLQAKS